MIHEGVIITRDPERAPHITPLGFERTGATVVLRPFIPSRTLDNLKTCPCAVMNFTEDVRVTAGCLTGRRDWPVIELGQDRWRLVDCVTHLELEVMTYHAHDERPRFECRVLAEVSHRPWTGPNRAQAAVLEASILVSRLDFIDPGKLAEEMRYLHIAVSKTAGERELSAWHWLLDAIAEHPRHDFDPEPLR